ncbi:MAG TPA: 4-hydroxythreonine-4-phosphate dehydrogenase PdxA [Gemmatimonadaceae bacterium]|nr:4-hydroxythreonine-4-phosphate dehydrogenase PdxA [Gemmatimonadaceae bacterium]
MRTRLAVTIGDPRGIGPEIVRAALADQRVGERCELLVVGPVGIGVDVQRQVGSWTGTGAAEAGKLAGLAIRAAVRLAQEGAVDGIVTGPIDKSALLQGGFDFPGHTEMLASLTDSETAMMLTSTSGTAGGHELRVVLATTHIPLRDVPSAVTEAAIVRAARIAREDLDRWFGITASRIALCALNPHAGDHGRFGDEDDSVLRPAAERAGIAGPYPADTVFIRAMRGEFDAVIAPYHDVGMTAIKVAAFGSAVNVTLGLPFPRTSPDHGTALDIAGTGRADSSSFIAATLLCDRLARHGVPPGDHPEYGDR